MDAETGALITDVQLGENHSALAFADNDTLYLGSDAGVLRSLTINRAGGLSMRNVWTSAAALQNIEVSRNNHYLVIVDATDTARILDLRDGTVGEAGLQLPGPVHDIVFSPGDSRVLFKTARWIHRASVSLAGLVWLDAVRAPKALSGSRMVFEDQPDIDRPLPDTADPFGDRVIVLTRDAGFAEVAELNFGHTAGPTLIGNKTELLSEWRDKLLMAAEPAAADPAN